MPDVVRRKLALGITKFKCSTIAEAEMVAQCGAPDVLLAYQPVGPNAARLALLATIIQRRDFQPSLTTAAPSPLFRRPWRRRRSKVEVLLDLDVGMHRSGIAPGAAAVELYRLIAELARIVARRAARLRRTHSRERIDGAEG